MVPVYLAGSRYLLLISTGSTFMKIEGKCFSSLSTFTLGGSNCARPPWLVLGRLCPLLLLTTYHIYITLTTNPHENVILGYNDIMLKTKTILREQSRPFRLPHSVVLAIEETVDVWFEETRSTTASTDCLGKRQDWQEQKYQQQQKSTAGILHLMFWCKSWLFKNMMHRIPLRLAKGDSSGFLYHDPCE